jgi:hypothetical protein
MEGRRFRLRQTILMHGGLRKGYVGELRLPPAGFVANSSVLIPES